MAEQQTTSSSSSKKTPETSGEHLEGKKALEAGWFGSRNNLHPDEAYTLRSGPDSPTGEHGPE